MNQGFIFEWEVEPGLGKIMGCSLRPPVEFVFSRQDCCPALRQRLALPENAHIHAPNVCPGIGSIQVKFDIDLNGDAINVCTVA